MLQKFKLDKKIYNQHTFTKIYFDNKKQPKFLHANQVIFKINIYTSKKD